MYYCILGHEERIVSKRAMGTTFSKRAMGTTFSKPAKKPDSIFTIFKNCYENSDVALFLGDKARLALSPQINHKTKKNGFFYRKLRVPTSVISSRPIILVQST
jgi:hypothetical protein